MGGACRCQQHSGKLPPPLACFGGIPGDLDGYLATIVGDVRRHPTRLPEDEVSTATACEELHTFGGSSVISSRFFDLPWCALCSAFGQTHREANRFVLLRLNFILSAQRHSDGGIVLGVAG